MPPNDGPRPRRTRILTALSVAVAVAVSAAVGVAVWARGAEPPPATRAQTIPVRTVKVTRTDLSTSRSLAGSIGYGASRVVKGGRSGVVTSLPRTGQLLKRGTVTFRVDDEPVPLFFGNPPLYRTLSARDTVGRDVAMVLENLRALGYATGGQPGPGSRVKVAGPERPPTVRTGEAVLTATLIAAIKRWQHDAGMTADGVLEVGDVVVLPGPVRVDSVSGVIGDDAAGPIMSVTQPAKVVSAQVGAPDAGSLRKGAAVTLRMPDGAEAPGRISAVANVATTPEGQPAGGPQQVAVTIEPRKPVKLDGGTVEIKVKGETRTDVLAVPVNALLALREGGYALQLPDNRLLPVETGLFAMGLVEVSGDGVDDGLTVVTTS
ncbi:efflux RND transporter periplasmic adaptor subunit [Actinoplanes sp. NPDC049265]|uniref:efflux RND transporter periplasmic adaptor subunit n=1 Tax=Actinoplanes sp. NPDC049265 TaxID=3363902 RepID=UPI003711ADE5